MTHRISLSFLLCTFGLITSQAQFTKQDSIRLKNLLNGDGEIKINLEAVKDIHFDFNPTKEIMKSKPVMNEDKPWMKYLEDLPKNYLDTTKWVKPKFIRLAPYTVYTKYSEDPVNDPIVKDKKDTLSVRFKINTERVIGLKNGYRVVPKGMDQSVTPSNNPTGTFSADDLLAPVFSKKARTRKHNAKHANAWKTYEKTLAKPELFYNEKGKQTPADSLTLKRDSVMIKRDSIMIRKDSLLSKEQLPKTN